jgi:hypothetical protein
MPLLPTIPPPNLPKLHQETKIIDLAPPAMSPFQDNHQPTHAGQHAGASSSAPDEEPIASSFTGAGPPFDFSFMDAPGIWNHELGSQNAFDSGLNEPWMMPSDYTPNYWADEPLDFSTGFASQSVPGPAFNEQLALPLFDPILCMDQPTGLWDAEVASTNALFAGGQAPIASGGGPSYLQNVPFDLNQADWTNHGAGMPDASGGSADPR